MTPEQVQDLISQRMPGAQVRVSGGEGKFEATVISDEFSGMESDNVREKIQARMKAEQRVYGTVSDEIASGAIHALTVRPFTPSQWQQAGQD
ncbi:cell division protein BolA [Thioalkalivibrio denitrificans]|uniref:Cell division protein BolA n=1 Tax=Thioalkalivibrio denitrificans TaxID=108003 RepID=A0A1V3NJ10_9GAMM|nr:BolA/IbaG family iron-sulfur metabolism protein [Thioalkalivibrio denitrificans]OOG24746.1 cell division protein BolA [Thioalkalivibrio denitrificans]